MHFATTNPCSQCSCEDFDMSPVVSTLCKCGHDAEAHGLLGTTKKPAGAVRLLIALMTLGLSTMAVFAAAIPRTLEAGCDTQNRCQSPQDDVVKDSKIVCTVATSTGNGPRAACYVLCWPNCGKSWTLEPGQSAVVHADGRLQLQCNGTHPTHCELQIHNP